MATMKNTIAAVAMVALKKMVSPPTSSLAVEGVCPGQGLRISARRARAMERARSVLAFRRFCSILIEV